MNRKFVVNQVVILIFGCLFGAPAHAQDWSAFRGADGTGKVDSDGALADVDEIGLKVRWKIKLGSGYSSVVVSKGRVVTAYCDSTKDLLGCFNAENGEKLWAVPTGERFKGENGSFDGPIATPVIFAGKVYFLSPQGKLACYDVSNGDEVWARDLVVEDGAKRPLYGFATSPLVVGNKLLVQVGGSDNSLTAFDRATGEVIWACTTDSINSQTPVLMTVDGKQIVLAAGGKKLSGIDPKDGTVLFEHEHKGSNGSAMVPVVFDGTKVLLTLDDAFSTAVEIQKQQDAFQVAPAWKERSIKNTYNVPVVFDGNLYAFSTRILTCVDAATGKAKWKSRKPGDGFLIVVDGHVIVNTKQGGLYVLRASDSGYQEVAGMQLFDDLVWSIPAYTQGAVYLRSLGELACVELAGGAAETIASTESKMGSRFSEMLTAAARSKDPQSVVDRFLDEQTSFPLVEEGLAHFIYQGDVQDAAVAGDMFGARQEEKMVQIGGTNTWYYVADLPADVRLNYVFLIDFKPRTDPRNPRTATSTIYAGEMEFAVRLRNEAPLKMSWFGMPNWKQPEFTEPVEKLRGTLVKQSVPSELLGKPYDVEVYVPPVPEEGASQRHPVVYAFDGTNAKLRGKLHEVVDNLVATQPNGIRPMVVFVDGPPVPKFLKSVATELVPFIDKKFNTIQARESRACVSNGLVAPMSLQVLANYPDVFSVASVQTPLIFDADQQQAIDDVQKIDVPVKIYLEWGTFDMFNPDENWDARKIGRRLYDEFSKSDKVQMFGGEVPDSSDWSSWRNRFDRTLELLQGGSVDSK